MLNTFFMREVFWAAVRRQKGTSEPSHVAARDRGMLCSVRTRRRGEKQAKGETW